jgi:hypothetical protein
VPAEPSPRRAPASPGAEPIVETAPAADPSAAGALEPIEAAATVDVDTGIARRRWPVFIVVSAVALLGIAGAWIDRGPAVAARAPAPESGPEAPGGSGMTLPDIAGSGLTPAASVPCWRAVPSLTGAPSAVPSRAASITADYAFRRTLIPSGDTAPSLVTTGDGEARFRDETVAERSSGSVLAFPEGTGLSLDPSAPVLDRRAYTIELLFRLDTTSGYRKLVDLTGGTSDAGLYAYGGCLGFYPRSFGVLPAIGADRWVHVVLTRDAHDTVAGYVDGVRWFAFRDRRGDAVIDGDALRFFVDDVATDVEASGGAVARIRLYDGPLGTARILRGCAELRGGGCGSTMADYVDGVDAICGTATDVLTRSLEELGDPTDVGARSRRTVRVSLMSLAALRALPAPHGVDPAWLDRRFRLLEPPIALWRQVSETAAAGHAVASLLHRVEEATRAKEERVMDLGRSELGLSLQGCPVALPS